MRSLTAVQVEDDVASYLSLLDRNAPEREIHQFLSEHSYFFGWILDLRGYSPLYSKVKLGTEFETDFVFFEVRSFGIQWHLVEIEQSSKPLFTNAGVPSAPLTQAVQQMRDWQDWIHKHGDYARNLLPHIDYPMCHLFIGRRSSLTVENKKRLRRYCYDERMHAEIHTLDNLAEQARSAKTQISPEGGGTWWIPMRSYSQSDLADKRPKAAFDKLDDPHTIGATLSLRDERISNLDAEVYHQTQRNYE